VRREILETLKKECDKLGWKIHVEPPILTSQPIVIIEATESKWRRFLRFLNKHFRR